MGKSKALTDAGIRAIEPPATGNRDVADPRSPGLFLRVTSTGVKAWSFRFTDPIGGQRQRMALPRYPDMSLADARERADELRRLVAKGINPIEAKRQEREEAPTRTFKALADRYLIEHAQRFKRSAPADRRNLDLHVLPQWGKRPFASIMRPDIIKLVEGLIADGKPIQANRVQSLISKIFSFALDSALRDDHPAARLKKRSRENANTRILTDDELRLFWSRIIESPVSKRTGLALRLALLTGLRAGEVAGLHRPSEIINLDDPEQAALLIPASRSKNKRAHLVPLSAMARQLVLDAQEIAGDAEYLFPTRNVDDDDSTSRHVLAKAMRRFADKLADDVAGAKSWKANPPTPHDLRRTLATRISELGVAKEDRDALLNHVRGDVGSRHYDLYDRHREKRAALNLWANALADILGNGRGNVVVALRRPT